MAISATELSSHITRAEQTQSDITCDIMTCALDDTTTKSATEMSQLQMIGSEERCVIDEFAQICGSGGGMPRIGAGAHRALSPRWPMVRHLSVSPGLVIKYEELKDLMKNDGVVLIDVREPWETKEYGIIKGSVNIPLGDLQAALQLSPKEFEAKYHVKLPEKSNTVVFSCLAGIRSGRALEVATSLGYSRIHHYSGGFEEWARHEVTEKPQ
ncbi:PREDICTED: thiosulfate sulfurtransferase/rhodanese-like domain-containing protein 3 [Nanorana parkeri]|uniref:thiosulfate sulfurtransferase/rhodanese-like domain-containing protein 3 n=1 Tax=Nanorana parkeri TaxID=125878 RepID=UPI000854D311|nr:PREDICTED: thiosulfate sulfurtransferase/rhodanese-like domain-containing protein 3 [Nanorana parkeri]